MDASVLVELLDNHSDIDAAGLTALACASKSFRDAVDTVWTAREEAYRRRCRESGDGQPKPLPLPKDWTDAYPVLADSCLYHTLDRPLPFAPGDRPMIRFDWGQELSDWTRRSAMMPGSLAKKDYFLDAADLKTLQPFRDGTSPRFFRFEDVLSAGMLRHGRAKLADMMTERACKRDAKAGVRRARWHTVWNVVGREGIAEDYLTMSVVHSYAKGFVDTGRGGIRCIVKSILRHRVFSFTVSRCTPNAPLYLRPIERIMVSHLQLGYVLTQKMEFLEDAKRLIRDMRGASGAPF